MKKISRFKIPFFFGPKIIRLVNGKYGKYKVRQINKLNKSISHSSNPNFSIEENAKSLIDAILNDTLDPSIQLWLVLIGESITNDNLVNFIQDENNLYETVLANQIKIINKKMIKFLVVLLVERERKKFDICVLILISKEDVM